MHPHLPNRYRSTVAIICLFAVALLYAPLATTAWSSYKASCCNSDECPIREHHHHKAPATPAHHMDCGHDMASMMSCSMSCCANQERPAVASAIFILPLPFEFAATLGFTRAVSLAISLDSSRSTEPLSPPPRFVSAAA